MPAWHAQTGTILPFSMCLKVVNEHDIAKAKLICCLCSLHLFVRWSIRKKFLSYIFINTVYFIPVYSQIHVDERSKVEGSLIYYWNQETSLTIRCVQKTTAECSVIFACVLKTTAEWWMSKLGNAHILSLLFYTMLKTMFSFKNFHPNRVYTLSNWCSRYVQT